MKAPSKLEICNCKLTILNQLEAIIHWSHLKEVIRLLITNFVSAKKSQNCEFKSE